MALHEELERLLRQTGAALVGFADLRNVAASPCPTGVSVAIPLPPQILQQLKTAPTQEYYDMYYAWNARLDTIVRTGAQYLQSRGFYAKACTVDSIHKDQNALTPLPHKTVATRAGLGWIGKSCLRGNALPSVHIPCVICAEIIRILFKQNLDSHSGSLQGFDPQAAFLCKRRVASPTSAPADFFRFLRTLFVQPRCFP